ncbi:MAG: hypothetical protein ABJL99_07945 [Aliishimia sp.]
MNLATLATRTKEYELAAAITSAAITARAALAENPPSPADVLAILETFPSPEKFDEFVQKMPKTPSASAVMAAFKGEEAKLEQFVNTSLSGNVDVLAAMAANGCERDPAKLKAFAAAFEADPTALQDMIGEGGFGENPDAMAAVFSTGCEGEPAAFKTFCGTFGDTPAREKLGRALNEGGLGMAPDALAGLAGENKGLLLKKLTEDFDDAPKRKKLNDLLTGTSLDGTSPGRPELLKDVIKDGLGGDPARLLEMHTAFDCNTKAGADDFDRLVLGFDGDDGKGGKRMGTLMGAYTQRDSSLTNAQLAAKMKDPYLSSITKMNASAGVLPMGGPANTAKTIETASNRTPPAPAVIAGQLSTAIPVQDAGAIFAATLPDLIQREEIAAATTLAAGMAGVGAELVKTDAEGDAEQTPLTEAATKTANEAADIMNKRLEGATPAEITALLKTADDAMAAAALEPLTQQRQDAVDAATKAALAAQTAMARAAATAMSKSDGAAAAQAAQSALKYLPASLPVAVKEQAKDYADLAMSAAVGSAASAEGSTKSAEIAAAALKEITESSADTGTLITKNNEDAARATAAAIAITQLVLAAAHPVDPALLKRAQSAAQSAQTAGIKAPDATIGKAAFDAAVTTLKAVADAVTEAAMRFEALRVSTSTTGKAAMKNLAPADAGLATADKVLSTNISVLAGAQTDVTAAQASTTALGLFTAKIPATQKAEAQAAAKADADAKNGGAASPAQITQEQLDLQTAALAARTDADKARDALKAANPSANPTAFNALLKTAADAGELAFNAAQKVVDDGERALTLTAAKDCLDAVDAASKLPQFEVLAAAQSAKADLDVATTSARNAALTGADADAMTGGDKAALEQAAKDAAYRSAAATSVGVPSDETVTLAIAAADKAAVDATSAAELARTTLAGLTMATDTADYAAKIKDLADKAQAALTAAAGAVDETKRNNARDKAKECATAAAVATKALALHHQTKAKEAAFKKQNADLKNAAGPRDDMANSANAQALFDNSVKIDTQATGAENRANGKRTAADQSTLDADADTKTIAAATREKGAALTPLETANALVGAVTAAANATVVLQAEIVALGGADIQADATGASQLIESVRLKGLKLIQLALACNDQITRQAALQEVENGSAAIRTAMATVAADTLDDRNDLATRHTEMIAAVERGKTALVAAVSADLAELSETEIEVRDLRDAAEAKQILAELPGADLFAKLDALVATRDAAIKLAHKAQLRFNGFNAPYPNVPPNPVVATGGVVLSLPVALSGTVAMPPNAQVDFQRALTSGKCASSAFVAALTAAQQVKSQSTKMLAQAKAVKKPTAGETKTIADITPIESGADTIVTDLEKGQTLIFRTIDTVSERALEWTAWANSEHPTDAATADFQAVAGFAAAEADSFKYQPVSEADLIRVAPSMINQNYTGPARDNITVGTDTTEVDMGHITERHVRSTYQFDNESCPKGSEKDMGFLLNAQLAGLEGSSEEKRLIRESGRDKPNSFFPEAVDAAAAKTLAASAMTQAQANLSTNAPPTNTLGGMLFRQTLDPPLPPRTQKTSWKGAFHDDDAIVLNIPPNIGATIGVKLKSNPGGAAPGLSGVYARMFYPNEGDKLSTPDVLVIAKALGVSK